MFTVSALYMARAAKREESSQASQTDPEAWRCAPLQSNGKLTWINPCYSK